MDWKNFIEKIVEKGIAAAKRDYTRKDQKAILKGSIAGFKACLGKDLLQLRDLYMNSLEKSRQSYMKDESPDEHWYVRGYALEIEWVCNVVSAALYNQGMPTIVPPTARGMNTAADILGVAA